MRRLHYAVLALFQIGLPAGGGAIAGESGDLLLHNVTIVSPERRAPLDGGWIAIREGTIAAVGQGEPELDASWSGVAAVDGRNRYLTPGLIDSHVHLASIPGFPYPVPAALAPLAAAYEVQLPRSYLYFGYTTLIDLAVSDRTFLDRFRQRPLHPDVFDCDGALPMANGYPMAFLPADARFEPYPNFLYDARQADAIPPRYSPEAHSPAAAVDRVAANGGICVKIFWETGFGPLRNLPVPTPAMLAEAVRASRTHGLTVTMHANSLAAHRAATEAGVDVVVHGLWNAPDGFSESVREVLDTIVSDGIGYMPTMQVLAGLGLMFQPDFLDDPALAAVVPEALIEWYRSEDGQWFARELKTDFGGADDEAMRAFQERDDSAPGMSRRTTRYLAERDARLLFGSDTPSAPTYGNPPGLNGYLEMKNLAGAGVPLRRLLAAATLENAKAFGLADRYGSVEPGKVANLLLLATNPVESVEAWDTIEAVVLHGKWIERSSLSARRLEDTAADARAGRAN